VKSDEKRADNSVPITFGALLLTGLVWSVLCWMSISWTGCATTVIPRPVEALEAGWDGGSQTSGMLLSTATGYVVTGTFRARYNLLVATYGRDFAPPLERDAGLTAAGEDRWLITKEGMQHMIEMTAWRRAGLKPKNL